MRAILPVLAAVVGLTGCNSEKPPPPAPSASATVTAVTAPATSPAAGGARKVSVDTALVVFDYSYPAAAGAIAGLRAQFDADIEDQLTALKKDAAAGREEARSGGFPFRPYAIQHDWQVVTDLPAWLSLSVLHWFDSGGAHGNSVYDALLWDKRAGVAREPLDLFSSSAALSAVIREDFCAALDRQRAEKRGEPVNGEGGDAFTECIDPVAQTVILGSSNGKAFDRIGILVPPYEAGSYAEGTYEVTLPVTAAVLGAVKPAFRSSFAAAR